jgi:hypothetical protein
VIEESFIFVAVFNRLLSKQFVLDFQTRIIVNHRQLCVLPVVDDDDDDVPFW